MINIRIVLIILAVKIAKLSHQMSEETLDRSNIETQYIARTIMITMFEETERYIRNLNEYIQTIETRKFKNISKKNFDLFINKYNNFLNEARELERRYQKIKQDSMEDDKIEKFKEQIKILDKSFTEATKTYTRSYRKINQSLTKLDATKIMYTDAEIFKTFSKITIRTMNHITAMEKLIEILHSRADECGTITNRDDFYEVTLKELSERKQKIQEISDSYPDSILKESEYDDLSANYKKVKVYYDESIQTMKDFDKSLEEKYKSNQVKYNKIFQKTIQLISKLPFRISAFVTPSVVGTFLISFCVIFQM